MKPTIKEERCDPTELHQKLDKDFDFSVSVMDAEDRQYYRATGKTEKLKPITERPEIVMTKADFEDLKEFEELNKLCSDIQKYYKRRNKCKTN